MARIDITNQTEPVTPTSGTSSIYVDSVTKVLASKDSDGVVHEYTTVATAISDAAFGAGWNGVVNSAPSKNAVYDEMILKATIDNPTFTTRINTPEIKAANSGGIDVHNSSGTQVALFGAGPSTGTTLVGTTNIGSASADYLQISGGTGSTTLTATGSSSNVNVVLAPKGSGGVTIDTTSPSARLQIGDSITPTQTAQLGGIGLRVNTLSTSTSGGFNSAISAIANTNTSANGTTTLAGGYFEALNPATNTFNVGVHRGIIAQANHSGSGTATSVQAVVASAGNGTAAGATTNIQAIVGNATANSTGTTALVIGAQVSANNLNTTTGIVTSAIGMYAFLQNGVSGTPTMTEAIGVRTNIVANPGTIGTFYGLKLDQTGPGTITTNYGVYQSYTGMNVLYGNTRIGSTTAPTVALDVTGAVLTSSTATIGDNLILPKTSGVGIKVDTATPTFGWRDMISEVDVKGTGANDPTFAVYTGTNFRVLQFSATVMQECFVAFHVPHDYVPGTDIYFHTHWSNAAATPNTGNVIWGFEYSYAKGHQQAAFPASSTVTVTQACNATRYYHHIAETAAVTISGCEVDGLIMVRCYRDAAAGGDTCTDAVFLHFVDLHYQSTNMATKQKAPNFYT